MGQTIEVATTLVGESAIFSTDRSITGQDGVSYVTAAAAEADDRFPGRLASELFDAVDGLTSVFVASNQVVVTRNGGWDDDTSAAAASVIQDFFLFYRAAG